MDEGRSVAFNLGVALWILGTVVAGVGADRLASGLGAVVVGASMMIASAYCFRSLDENRREASRNPR